MRRYRPQVWSDLGAGTCPAEASVPSGSSARRLTEQVLAELREVAEVSAILGIGSQTIGTADQASDLDLVVICDQRIPPAADRLARIHRYTDDDAINVFDDRTWEFGTTDDFALDGLEVCTSYYERADIFTKLAAIQGGRYERTGFYYPLGFVAALASAHLLYDRDHHGARLRALAGRYPEPLRRQIQQEQRDLFHYYMNRLRAAATRRDAYFAYELLGLAMHSLLHLLFATHRVYFRAPKKLAQQLAALPIADPALLHRELEWLAQAPNDPDTLDRKRDRLRALYRAHAQDDPGRPRTTQGTPGGLP
ncbi:hypothetical protein [Haliangium sp.]|uniref:hypothetical protein n=1 Tax=Haliangium sp. TaxID=2663208 RepID=UPI003D10E4E2